MRQPVNLYLQNFSGNFSNLLAMRDYASLVAICRVDVLLIMHAVDSSTLPCVNSLCILECLKNHTIREIMVVQVCSQAYGATSKRSSQICHCQAERYGLHSPNLLNYAIVRCCLIDVFQLSLATWLITI